MAYSKVRFFASFEINNGTNIIDLIKRLYIKDILIGDMSRYYLKNHINNKFMRISISGANNEDIKKGISIIVNEIKD